MRFFYSANKIRHNINQNAFGHKKYTWREKDDLQTKYAQLARKLESLELKKVHMVSTSSSSEEIFVICDRQEHCTVECPTLLAFKEVLQNEEQISVNTLNTLPNPFNSAFSNMYNPGSQNHPNLSWKMQKKQILGYMGKLMTHHSNINIPIQWDKIPMEIKM